jgi:hypothetical protein
MLTSSSKTTTTANDKETMMQLLRLLQIFMFREINVKTRRKTHLELILLYLESALRVATVGT